MRTDFSGLSLTRMGRSLQFNKAYHPRMSEKIFISYRRSEAQWVAGRLHASLVQPLGDNAIFRDKESIGPGDNWPKAVEAALVTGKVTVLALIGPSWAKTLDEAGIRGWMIPPTGIEWNSSSRSSEAYALSRC